MPEEPLFLALCWELDCAVGADYAEANRALGFQFFCPVPDCLAPVHPRREKNVWFVANKRHVPGCPNDKSGDGSSRTGARQHYDRAEPPSHTPNLLGPMHRINRGRPSAEQLRLLARRNLDGFPMCPGTLAEVVRAYTDMPPRDRRQHPLTIENQILDYQTAFQTAALHEPVQLADAIHQPTIRFCNAKVRKYGRLFSIWTRKHFTHEGAVKPLVFAMRPDDPSESRLERLTDQEVTVFWRKLPLPAIREKGFWSPAFLDTTSGIVWHHRE
ncbi:hypothetical protein [Paracoccus aminovorans]|uniref:hypothetical protein n=1 Tax=Paracoccus aminovorans TaxID=34004 RepID=UPI000A5C03B1|nr:hypothetical protein [Paracoccus aminovorans]MDQ7777495.1 hypothetical protein [Paracoccus aminovorans]